jgi:predicted protein tyrosine phosphatase
MMMMRASDGHDVIGPTDVTTTLHVHYLDMQSILLFQTEMPRHQQFVLHCWEHDNFG